MAKKETKGNRELGREGNIKRKGTCPLLTQSIVAVIKLSKINFFLSSGKCTEVAMQNGTVYKVRTKIEFFEKYIDDSFYKQGKYYINLSRIESITSDAVVTFDNGEKLYFTKKTYVGLKQSFARYILQEA